MNVHLPPLARTNRPIVPVHDGSCDNAEIFFKDLGSGQRVVCHHGWPVSADDCDAQLTFVVQRVDVGGRPRFHPDLMTRRCL